jgi:hypothetical protein
MRKESRKLSLDRETLMPMQSDELAGVNGGITPTVTTVTTSSGGCTAIVAASIGTVSMAFCASRWCR